LSLVRNFIEAYHVPDGDTLDDIVSLDRVGLVDNVCHGKEGYLEKFFYMYLA